MQTTKLTESTELTELMSGNTSNIQSKQDLLTVSQARQLIGFSHQGLLTAVKRGDIAAVKILGRWYIRRSDIDDIVAKIQSLQ